MTTKIPAAMVDADVATQAELDVVSGVASGAASAAALKLSGDVVQVVNVQTGAMASGTTVLPFDDTIPQNTEGNEFMTLAITPTSATNVLLIEVTANVNASAVNYITAALFQDATADALAAVAAYQEGAGRATLMNFTHRMVSGTVAATTFKVRIGTGGAATLTFNGEAGARKLGGVMASSITITEIKV
jgi:hypothetical protein